jgi:dihydroflavonol-4-reductase
MEGCGLHVEDSWPSYSVLLAATSHFFTQSGESDSAGSAMAYVGHRLYTDVPSSTRSDNKYMHNASSFVLGGQKILVTGGNGFIGSVVVKTLLQQGCQVRCLLRESSKTDRLAGLDYERALGDVRDLASVKAAVAGCQGVIHAAGLSNWDLIDSPLMKEISETGTRNVLEAARDAGVARVVYVSSASSINGSDEPKVFDETSTFELEKAGLNYANCKRAAEKICLAFNAEGLPVVIVNPPETYGPNDTELVTAGNIVDVVKSSPVVVCSGGTIVGHIDDVALGIVRALERGRPGERYILGGENKTVRELAEITLELLGVKKRIILLPNALIRGAARGALALRIPFPLNPRLIPYATRYWFFDSSKAQRELGVTFRSARDTFAPTLAWLRETGRVK